MSVFKNRFADKNSSKSNSDKLKPADDSNQNNNDYEEDIGEDIEGNCKVMNRFILALF